ncbi:dTDP-4-amino-4,6-dideoxygalactose transaminase [Candidatus Woesearchaeota archaeon]|jgi:dTDP-4-amino-4,6-dideoxygalactose transaminase|nr:dTDP-4-amino-4,6-dideoxygalactose transaminase [Candidatus Woesearchaeota archaeon]
MSNIPFNKPHMTGKELVYIEQAYKNGQLAGDGPFTKKCHQWIKDHIGCEKALLTHSCTAALEMSAILIDIKPGDEIIMPSYTFVSTANAFVLRGGVPVFVDIREDTLNIDEMLIEDAITQRTKAIVPIHYAGVACEMNVIMDIAKRHSLFVIEDAAQGIMSTYKGKCLGSIGHLGCLSFHETKNIISGEGGVLLINDKRFVDRAEIIREKGTDRSCFFRGEVGKYTWKDIGSSFLPGEITAAFLFAQLEKSKSITDKRLLLWSRYNEAFKELGSTGKVRLPVITSNCKHNAHIYYLLLGRADDRNKFIEDMQKKDINCIFHYVPLHLSDAGIKYGRNHGNLNITERHAKCIVRLPLWVSLSKKNQERVISSTFEIMKDLS